MVGPNFPKEWESESLSKTKLFVSVFSPYTLFCVLYFDLNVLAALYWKTTGLVKKCNYIKLRASDQKQVQISCTIKATRTLIYYCVIEKLRMLRMERWGLKVAWWRLVLRRVLMRVKVRRRVLMIGKARKRAI